MTVTVSQRNDAAIPNIKVRPPLLFIAALLLGTALDHLLPLPIRLPRDEGLAHKLVPGSLVLLGLALSIAGIRNFSRADTPVPGDQPVRALVTTGIHGWSRNPIYIGLLLFYVGVGVALRSSWSLVLAPLAVLVLRYAVITREEAYLDQRFGEVYRVYKARVRRWL